MLLFPTSGAHRLPTLLHIRQVRYHCCAPRTAISAALLVVQVVLQQHTATNSTSQHKGHACQSSAPLAPQHIVKGARMSAFSPLTDPHGTLQLMLSLTNGTVIAILMDQVPSAALHTPARGGEWCTISVPYTQGRCGV